MDAHTRYHSEYWQWNQTRSGKMKLPALNSRWRNDICNSNYGLPYYLVHIQKKLFCIMEYFWLFTMVWKCSSLPIDLDKWVNWSALIEIGNKAFYFLDFFSPLPLMISCRCVQNDPLELHSSISCCIAKSAFAVCLWKFRHKTLQRCPNGCCTVVILELSTGFLSVTQSRRWGAWLALQ